MDPFEIFQTSLKTAAAWAAMPEAWLRHCRHLADDVQDLLIDECRAYLAAQHNGRIANRSPEDQWWTSSKHLARTSKKLHGLWSGWINRLAQEAPDLTADERRRSMFWTRQLTGAWHPDNCLWLNAQAVKRLLDTNGDSIRMGLRAFIEDLHARDGLSRLVADQAFRIGEDLAGTPGNVVYRNHLMELIQYCPATPAVYDKPVVLIQPWINKYYIFDLQASNSLVRFLVNKGFSVFITSWKNPSADMRTVSFENYMLEGALTAIHVARRICKVDQVHAAGYCIGGTALASLMAWLHAAKSVAESPPVADWTLFAALVDFSEPGDLGVFIGRRSIDFIESLMERDGFLDGRFISLAFRLLKSDQLIWRTFTQSCLLGLTPPRSDVLYWNADATHLPQAVGSFLLNELYAANRLVGKAPLEVAGRRLDLKRIVEPLYTVGALQDHICPWPGTFGTCLHVDSPARYVLANEGHIAGIVNPPSPRSKKKYWAGNVAPAACPRDWLASQSVRTGSWWEDWAAWLPARGDVSVAPPSMGSPAYPVIEPAPGSYVREP